MGEDHQSPRGFSLGRRARSPRFCDCTLWSRFIVVLRLFESYVPYRSSFVSCWICAYQSRNGTRQRVEQDTAKLGNKLMRQHPMDTLGRMGRGSKRRPVWIVNGGAAKRMIVVNSCWQIERAKACIVAVEYTAEQVPCASAINKILLSQICNHFALFCTLV